MLKKVAYENFKKVSSLTFSYEKTMPLLNQYSSYKYFKDTNKESGYSVCLGEGGSLWFEGLTKEDYDDNWKHYKHYDVNNDSIIDEKDRKEYCGPEEKAREDFYNNNEFFEKIVNRKTISPTGSGGIFGETRESVSNTDVNIYKITSSPVNYFNNSKIAVILKNNKNPQITLDKFNKILSKVINDLQ